MNSERLDDMINRYGEVCSQKTVAKILNIVPRTVTRMISDGRLRKVGRGIDVRSVCAYIENAPQIEQQIRIKKAEKPRLSREDFLAAAKSGRWAARR